MQIFFSLRPRSFATVYPRPNPKVCSKAMAARSVPVTTLEAVAFMACTQPQMAAIRKHEIAGVTFEVVAHTFGSFVLRASPANTGPNTTDNVDQTSSLALTSTKLPANNEVR